MINKMNKPQFEKGDVVRKVFRTNNQNRQGIVLRTPDDGRQVVVLWENTKTAIYEFTSDISLVSKAKDQPDGKDLYCVFAFGGISIPKFHETYEQAELEAKNIFFKTNMKTYIFKALAVIDVQDVKVKKLIQNKSNK